MKPPFNRSKILMRVYTTMLFEYVVILYGHKLHYKWPKAR